ncbi:MAG: hypothetical protein M0Z44_04355 [Gammaproteobacteria bacterium]|nr:hypothetical protein [Gammaproteobacteria bacterium]
MKGSDPIRTTVLIVGRRRPWKKQFLLTGRRWQVGFGVVALVVPLMLTVVTYQVWNRLATVDAPTSSASSYRALARQVAMISTRTQAGLNALNGELGALAGNAARLSGLRDRLIGTMGLAPVAFRMPAPATPVASGSEAKVRPHAASGLMSALHQLAAQLRQEARTTGERST